MGTEGSSSLLGMSPPTPGKKNKTNMAGNRPPPLALGRSALTDMPALSLGGGGGGAASSAQTTPSLPAVLLSLREPLPSIGNVSAVGPPRTVTAVGSGFGRGSGSGGIVRLESRQFRSSSCPSDPTTMAAARDAVMAREAARAAAHARVAERVDGEDDSAGGLRARRQEQARLGGAAAEAAYASAMDGAAASSAAAPSSSSPASSADARRQWGGDGASPTSMFSFDEDQSPVLTGGSQRESSSVVTAGSGLGAVDIDDLSEGDSCDDDHERPQPVVSGRGNISVDAAAWAGHEEEGEAEEREGGGGFGSLEARRHQRRALMSRKLVSGRPPRARRGSHDGRWSGSGDDGAGGDHGMGVDIDLDMGSLNLREGALAPAHSKIGSGGVGVGGVSSESHAIQRERRARRVAQSGGSLGSEGSFGGSFDAAVSTAAKSPGGGFIQQPTFGFGSQQQQQQQQQRQRQQQHGASFGHAGFEGSPPVVPFGTAAAMGAMGNAGGAGAAVSGMVTDMMDANARE